MEIKIKTTMVYMRETETIPNKRHEMNTFSDIGLEISIICCSMTINGNDYSDAYWI